MKKQCDFCDQEIRTNYITINHRDRCDVMCEECLREKSNIEICRQIFGLPVFNTEKQERIDRELRCDICGEVLNDYDLDYVEYDGEVFCDDCVSKMNLGGLFETFGEELREA